MTKKPIVIENTALETCALKVETYEQILDALFQSIAERYESAGLSLLEDFEKTAGEKIAKKFYSFPRGGIGGLSNQDQMKIVESVFSSLLERLRNCLAKHAH